MGNSFATIAKQSFDLICHGHKIQAHRTSNIYCYIYITVFSSFSTGHRSQIHPTGKWDISFEAPSYAFARFPL